MISPLQGSYLTQTQNKHKQTTIPRVGFEPTLLEFERARTVHALDRAAAVIGILQIN
jgi:FAD synthase